MKYLRKIVYMSIVLFLLVSLSAAQAEDFEEMTVVVPEQSIARVIEPLLPYKIDLGKELIGEFSVESIENIRIKNNRVYFSSLISGKDIKYATKVGKQVINFVVGDVNLPSNWEVVLKLDKAKNRLLVTPNLKEVKGKKEYTQGDALLNALLTAGSGIEYPVDLNDIKPIKSEFNNQLLTVNMNVSNVYARENKLYIELKPVANIKSLKRRKKK